MPINASVLSRSLRTAACLLIAGSLPDFLHASTISASSTNPAIGPANAKVNIASFKASSIDTFNNPTISWHSGPNTTDNKLWPGVGFGPENKFTIQYDPTLGQYVPVGRTFAGFNWTDTVFST